MTKEQIYSIANELFSFSSAEVDEYINKYARTEKEMQRLQGILQAVEPHCRKFYEQSDLKLRRKAGAVVFSTLDQNKYSRTETPLGTQNRLSELFRETSAKRNINIYKLLYTGVLTDANLKNDRENGVKFPEPTRNFVNIYGSLKKTLMLSDEETERIFERCTSLIAKAYSYRFGQVYGAMRDLYIIDEINFYRVFRTSANDNEVVNILKIDPSLFCTSADKIDGAFKYLRYKINAIAKPEGNVSKAEARLILARAWLKNNSSLLTINAETMMRKEGFFAREFAQETGHEYTKEIAALFEDPISLANMNQIPEKKLYENAVENIKTLQSIVGKEATAKYIQDNMMFLAMNKYKFENLLNKVELLDAKEDGYLDRFLQLGKSLFGASVEINEDKVLTKLKNAGNLAVLDVEKLDNKELLPKFFDFFVGENDAKLKEIYALIEEKERRNLIGEKELRRDIRDLGKEIVAVPKLVHREDVSIVKKKDIICNLATRVEQLFERRLKLADVNFYPSVRDEEIKISSKIENSLNFIRDTYEQNQHKVGKRVANVDKLYDRLMKYLGECFDDKEAIEDLFIKEISKPFFEELQQSFEAEKHDQFTFFGDNYIIKGVHPALVSPMNELSGKVLRENGDTVSFEKS